MKFTVTEADAGKTLRAFLREKQVSASLLAKLKRRENGITLDGVPVTVRALLPAGSVVELAVEDDAPAPHIPPRDLPLAILAETPDYIALNQPAGMPTHPSHGHYEDTLANALAFRFSTENAPFRPRFINRLDRNTSGVVLVARHALAAAVLSRAMAAGEFEKTYLAIVHGRVKEPRVIKTGIRRREASVITREVCPVGEGDLAVTHLFPLWAGETCSLVRLVPETGRTHQLRVHMASIGHPLLGDDLYGPPDGGFVRHALHAASLTFPAPDGTGKVTVRAPLPADLTALLKTLGKEVFALAVSQTEGP